MEMLLNLIVWLMISCTNAVLVRKLEGSVFLPMASGDSCGTYSCTPQLGNYCYAYVSLGFRTRSCNTVSIKAPFPYRLKTVNGAETLQIYSLGNNFQSWVRFELECESGHPCLDDNLIVMSLLYRCPDN